MNRALRAVSFAAITSLAALSIGCATAIPANEFIAKYTTNISVPNPRSSDLPCRIYLGRDEKYFYIKDVIPFGQGGGFFGTTALWRCPAAELPEDFPESFRPGDVILDGRIGAKHTYMIQYYGPASAAGAVGPVPAAPPATRPAGADQ